MPVREAVLPKDSHISSVSSAFTVLPLPRPQRRRFFISRTLDPCQGEPAATFFSGFTKNSFTRIFASLRQFYKDFCLFKTVLQGVLLL